MNHLYSTYANSCLRVPVDPISKMPKTAYERKAQIITDQNSIDSTSTVGSVVLPDHAVHVEKVKKFYQSIPDYNDINHLSAEEFYSTLKNLRDKKNKMLGSVITHVEFENGYDEQHQNNTSHILKDNILRVSKIAKTKENERVKSIIGSKMNSKTELKKSVSNVDYKASSDDKIYSIKVDDDIESKPQLLKDTKDTKSKNPTDKSIDKTDLKSKRNHSACSISWNDCLKSEKYDIDNKFECFFEGKNYLNSNKNNKNMSRSMPSSPIRTIIRPTSSNRNRRKSITVPRPFKMTER